MAGVDLRFFERDTLTVAQELLGRYLVRELPEGRLVCRITETEAYVGRMDKACHAYGYKTTKRTEPLYGKPGTIYIYLIYGMYHCLNFVTEAQGEPCAVLLRAASPIAGIDQMARHRFGMPFEQLTAYQRKNFLNGPGKLCSALALTRAQNNTLLGEELWVSDDLSGLGCSEEVTPKYQRKVGKRIGIDYAEEAVDFPWRFWLEEL